MSSPFRAWSDNIPFSTVVAGPEPTCAVSVCFLGLIVAACESMPHIGRRQNDQGDEDDSGQRTELAGLWGEAAIDAAHDLIGLCGASDLSDSLALCSAAALSRSSGLEFSPVIAILSSSSRCCRSRVSPA